MWAATALILNATFAIAQDRVMEAKASFIFNGQKIEITREATGTSGDVARFVSEDASCGGSCVFPMEVAPGVATLGELEVLDFLVGQVAANQGLMIDARSPADRAAGFIPGTVNLPHHTLDADNSFRADILTALGARAFEGVYNFADARQLLIYDNGPSNDDAGRLVRNLLEAGYPAEMIQYYRGGMQAWSVLGFSIQEGTS